MSTEILAATGGQFWLSFLLSLALIGLIAGAVARLLVPGPQPIGILGTMLVGMAGALLGGLVGRLLFGPGYTPGLIMSILGATAILFLLSRRSYGRGYGEEYGEGYGRGRGFGFGRRGTGLGGRGFGFGRRGTGLGGRWGWGRRETAYPDRRAPGIFGRRDHYDY